MYLTSYSFEFNTITDIFGTLKVCLSTDRSSEMEAFINELNQLDLNFDHIINTKKTYINTIYISHVYQPIPIEFEIIFKGLSTPFGCCFTNYLNNKYDSYGSYIEVKNLQHLKELMNKNKALLLTSNSEILRNFTIDFFKTL